MITFGAGSSVGIAKSSNILLVNQKQLGSRHYLDKSITGLHRFDDYDRFIGYVRLIDFVLVATGCKGRQII